jgi:hypothetical protein
MNQEGDKFVEECRLEVSEEPHESRIDALGDSLFQRTSFWHSVLELIRGGSNGLIPAQGGEVTDSPDGEDPEGMIEAPDREVS